MKNKINLIGTGFVFLLYIIWLLIGRFSFAVFVALLPSLVVVYNFVNKISNFDDNTSLESKAVDFIKDKLKNLFK